MSVGDYPAVLAPAGHVEPVPRRVRAVLAGVTVVDTTAAHYVWEWPNYPQYYIPLADVAAGVLVDEAHVQQSARGPVEGHGLRVGDAYRPRAAKVLRSSSVEALRDTVRFDWAAMDAWYEEDEQVFVHPRNPYTRVDCLRSTRSVRVALDGVVLADSSSPVLLFETGLPTRYYLNRTDVHFEHLEPTATVSSCPYKGTTSRYWAVRGGPEVAWTYAFPTREAQPIAGLVAFYNERVDLTVDGVALERPATHFSR